MTVMVKRPVSAVEAAHPQGAIVGALVGAGIEPTPAAILAVTQANGIPDRGRLDCAWAVALAAEVLARGGTRGAPTSANACERGAGFAIIREGNVWALPAPRAPSSSTVKTAGGLGLLVLLAAGGYYLWSK